MPRKPRTATARRITERERITEEVTVTDEDGDGDTAPVTWAAGTTISAARRPSEAWNAQRTRQREQSLGLLLTWDVSAPPGEDAPEWLIRQAVNILRALPGATPLEATLGRST